MTKLQALFPFCPTSEYSETFLKGMVNRMAVSHHKYGFVAESMPGMDAIVNVQKRISMYEETGNTEWPIDAANFLMMEFMHPKHEAAHFRGTDSHESPGVIRHCEA